MTSPARLWATISSVKYVVSNHIPGDFVECGVWRGGSSMAMARTLLDMSHTEKKLFLFDTFEGMTDPTEFDRDPFGNFAEDQLRDSAKSSGSNIWCIASLDDVRNNLSSTSYPPDLIHYVKGDVRNTLTIEANLPDKISLLRLDTDWYESTKLELEILFPRLAKGGVCLIDDYGHWQGARKALDEYLCEQKLAPLMHVTDYTGRAFIKT